MVPAPITDSTVLVVAWAAVVGITTNRVTAAKAAAATLINFLRIRRPHESVPVTGQISIAGRLLRVMVRPDGNRTGTADTGNRWGSRDPGCWWDG
jgi:hypothetical protein